MSNVCLFIYFGLKLISDEENQENVTLKT